MKTKRIQIKGSSYWKTLSLILAFCLLVLSGARSQDVTTQNSPGTYSFTVPQWVTELTVEAWGAGGGGSATVINGAKEGGGGGAYARSVLTVLPETIFNYTVGAGGGEGVDGGASSFDVLVIADGGKTDRIGGLASASTGQVRYNGGGGGITHNSTFYGRVVGGGGGAGASSTGNGSNGTYHFPGNWSGSFAGRGGWGGTQPANDNGGNANNPGGAGGGGGGPDGTSTSGSGASGRISITHVGLELESTTCECNNDQNPNNNDGTFSSILIIKTDDGTPLISGLDFTLITSTGIMDDYGQSLNGSAFLYCNGYSCPSGVAGGQYYLPVNVQHSGSYSASIDTDKNGSGDLNLNTNCTTSYPALPSIPSGLTDVICLDGSLVLGGVSNAVYNKNNTPFNLDLQDGFSQSGHVVLPDGTTTGSAVLTISEPIITADNPFRLHLVRQQNGCKVSSYKEFKVYNGVNPALKHTLAECRTPKTDDTVYLNTMIDTLNKGIGKFYINGNEIVDGKLGVNGPICESVTYTIIDSCGVSHSDTKSYQLTYKPTPSFEFDSNSPQSPVCAFFDVDVSLIRTSTGPNPEFTASSNNPSYTPVVDNPGSSVSLPAPPQGEVVKYTICLTETNDASSSCPGIPTPDPCSEKTCKDFIVYRDMSNCGINNPFSPSMCEEHEVSPCDASPSIGWELHCGYLDITLPPALTSEVRVAPEYELIYCNDSIIEGEYLITLAGINFDDGLGIGGRKLEDIPGISTVCSVLNFEVDLGTWTWRPFEDLYDLLNCDRTLLQMIAERIAIEFGGDGGGYIVMADTDGDGAFDYLIDKGLFPSSLDYKPFTIPNRMKREGEISIRAVGGFMNSPASVCGDFDIDDINLLDLLPIGLIPVVGDMIEAVLQAASCNVPLTQSVEHTKQIPVVNASPAEFTNCNTDGYVFAQTLDCTLPINWSVPSAVDGCSDESIKYRGVTSLVDISNYAGTETITPVEIDQAGIYQTFGPIPGSILQPGIYEVSYTAVGCSGWDSECTFNVTVTAGDPILECPNDIVVSTGVDECFAHVNGLAPYQGIGCASIINYSYTKPVSGTVVETNSMTTGSHNVPDGHEFELGMTTITYNMLVDINGDGDYDDANETQECSFSVTVVDEQLPDAVCIDVDLQLDNSGHGIVFAEEVVDQVYIDGGSTDNCNSDLTILLSKDNINYQTSLEFDCSEIGDQIVNLRVTDGSGNHSYCKAAVNVIDFFEDYQIFMDLPEICFEPFQNSYDFSPHLVISSPTGSNMGHQAVSTLGPNVVGAFGIAAFLPDAGSTADPGTITPDGIYTVGTGTGFITITYLLYIDGQVEQNNGEITGCFELAHDVFRIEKLDPVWNGGYMCCDQLPVWLGGASWDGSGAPPIPAGMLSLTDIQGSYPGDAYGEWTGDGVTFVDPDGIDYSGDEFFQFDPLGFDGVYTLTYTIGDEPCIFDYSQEIHVTCQDLHVEISDYTVCPANWVEEKDVLVNLDDANLVVSTTGFNELAADGAHYGGGPGIDAVQDLDQVPVVDGRVVIPGFYAPAIRQKDYEICVTAYQTNPFGCTDIFCYTITVEDLEAPEFQNCPKEPVVVDAPSGWCQSFVNFEYPWTEDNCMGLNAKIEQVDTTGLVSGDLFPVGLTVLAYTATDTVGNQSYCEIKIIVDDYDRPPEIACPADMEQVNDLDECGAIVNNIAPTSITDNCPDNLSIVYEIFNEENESITCGLEDASGEFFPVGTNKVEYTVFDQPLLLITEVVQDGNIAGIEITNFGPASMDITCGSFKLKLSDGTILEEYMVPTPNNKSTLTMNPIYPPDPTTWQSPTPNLIPVGGTYTYVFTSIPTVGEELIYSFEFLERIIDEILVNDEIIGEVFLRKDVCDHDEQTDFIAATPCDPGSFDMLNPGLPVMTDNGTKRALQNYDPSMDQCSFMVSVVDLEDPTCIKHDSVTVNNSLVPQDVLALHCLSSEVNMPPGLVHDVNLHDLRISIPDAGAVTAFLNSPEGTEILLFNEICAGTPDIDVTLDQTIVWIPSPEIEDALCGPMGQGGIYSPEESFKAFYGEEAEGLWTLEIYTTGNTSGILNHWELEILYQLPYDQEDVVLQNAPGECDTVFTWIHPIFEDNCCEGTVDVIYSFENAVTGESSIESEVILNENGTINLQGLEETRVFPVGTTTVEYVLTDQYGNISYCGFEVKVEDNELPVWITDCTDREILLYPTECYGELTDPPNAMDNCEMDGVYFYFEDGSVADIRKLPIGIHILTAVALDIYGNSISCQFTVTVVEFIPGIHALVCNDDVNLSLSADCEAVILADMILEGDLYRCYENYCIEVFDDEGEPHDNYFDFSDVGQYFMVIVSDCLDSDNNCMSTVYIEEAFEPQILCPADTVVSCNGETGPEFLGFVEILNCEPFADISFSDEVTDNGPCGEPLQEIVRTWTVKDHKGNEVSCEQTIEIERFSLEQLVFPEDVFTTDCQEFMENQDASHPENTGYPTIDGIPINENIGNCMLSYLWNDEVYNFCGNTFEILREWKVRDMCGDVNELNPSIHIQTIKVFDNTAPVIHECQDLVVNTSAFDCEGSLEIPLPMITDDCNDFTVDAVVSGTFVEVTGDYLAGTMQIVARHLSLGNHTAKFLVQDACGNKDACTFNILVVDAYPPIADCEQFKQVSITPEGSAAVFAKDFDSGSFDNCGPVWFKVLRGHETDENNELIYDGGCPGLNGDDSPLQGNQVWFDDEVYFCCEDLGSEIMVMLRVFDTDPGEGPVDPARMYNPNGDLYGSYSDCWSIVDLECKVPPVILSDDLYMSCESVIDPDENPDLIPEVIAACDFELVYEDSDKQGDVCSGYINRTWTATSCGMSVNSIQRIYLSESEPFDPCTIEFPADQLNIICPETNGNPGYPTWEENPCNIVTAEIINRDTFDIVEGACQRIFIDWAVIDWCVYEFNTSQQHVDAVQNRKLVCEELVEDGYYRYTQILEINDVYAPQILVQDSCIAATNGCYASDIKLEAQATDSCNVDDKFWWKYIVINMDTWETVQYSYNYEPEPDDGVQGSKSKDNLDKTATASLRILDPLSIGNYRVEWTVGDGCGNATSTYQYFEVRDKKPPTPFLVDISTALMSSGSVALNARFFDKGACNGTCLASFDDCSDEIYFTYTEILPIIDHPEWLDMFELYYFDPVSGEQFTAHEGRLKFLEGVAHSWNPELLTSGKVFLCEHAPFIFVDVYVWDQFALNGECDDWNYDFATAGLRLIDEDDGCGDEFYASLNGSTYNRNSSIKVENVEISVDRENPEYPKTVVSDGDYAFSQLPLGHYDLTANKYDEPMQGLSTLDLVLIQRHILGVKALEDPFDYIASDANESNSISAADLFILRNLILAKTQKFPEGRSWRFFDAEIEINNKYDPWDEFGQAEIIDLKLYEDLNGIDFVGVKIGDLNNTVSNLGSTPELDQRTERQIELSINDLELMENSIYEIPVYMNESSELFGMQFTLQAKNLEFLELIPGKIPVTHNNYGLIDMSLLTFSWNNVSGLDISDDDVLFKIKLKANYPCKLIDELFVSSGVTQAEAYLSKDLKIYGIQFGIRNGKEYAFELFQNIPNPFIDNTEIFFSLEQKEQYELMIYDVDGKLVREFYGEGQKGINSVLLQGDDLSPGVLYYELRTGSNISMKKMLLIK